MMIVDIPPVARPWMPDNGFALDLAGVTARFPVLANFHRRLGETPLREVPTDRASARILAKTEWTNPCGSIKDRTAFVLLSEVLHDRADTAGLRLVEYSGGNLAAPLALLCRRLGIDITLVLSDATPPAYVAMLRHRGATVELVERDHGFLGVIDHAREVAARTGAHLLYQHRSQANPWFHRVSTGAEVVRQLGGTEVHHLVASIGTGGTLAGVLAALRERDPRVTGVAVTPDELPYGSLTPPNGRPKYAGSGGLGNGIRQPFVRDVEKQIGAFYTVSRPDSIAAMREYHRRTGERIGSSAAANLVIASQVAADLGPGHTVVTIFPDAGSAAEWAEAGR